MDTLFLLAQKHWKMLSVLIIWLNLAFFLHLIGKKLERINSDKLILSWLSEIGSDIRLYGIVTSLSLTIAYASSVYSVYFAWMAKIGATLARVSAVFWLVLVAIAFIETAAPHFSKIITSSQMNQIDKRNALTLIPLTASTAKILIYIFAFIFGLAAFGVDISPLLNLSTAAIAIFGFAGAETLKDVLASLKIFIDRLYYVGSVVEISTDGLCKYEGQLKGVVIKITLFNTTIQLEKSATFNKSLTVANGTIRSIIVYQENAKLRK